MKSLNTSSDYLQQIPTGSVFLQSGVGEDTDMVFTGDICLDQRIGQICFDNSLDLIFGDLLPVLRKKDFSIANLECPLTKANSPIIKTGPNIRAHPMSVKALKYGEFDAVTLANNHIMDYGEVGLIDTIKACEGIKIKTVGAGMSLSEACLPLVVRIKNSTVTILNFAEHEFSIATATKAGACPLDIVDNYYQIKKAKENSDIVIVIIHGGNEHYNLPSPRLQKLCRFYADLGVSAVICHHSHCPSGLEIYNGVPIFYSLGNFIYDHPNVSYKYWNKSYLLKLTFRKQAVASINLIPFCQSVSHGGVKMMTGEKREQFLNEICQYSITILDAQKLIESWREYCKSVRYPYLASLIGLNRFEKGLLKYNCYPKSFLKKSSLKVVNYFTCEALRDFAQEILEQEYS